METSANEVVIAASKRTPIGQYLGGLVPYSAPLLASRAIQATVTSLPLELTQIDEIILGCVLSAGIGQAPARQAALRAGIPLNVGCTTINKMCGSGMKALMQAYDSIKSHSNQVVIAGGMESMSNAPYLFLQARQGYRMGHANLYDHMFLDGLEDAYDKGKLMGYFAEKAAKTHAISRQAQDKFALHSLEKAKFAISQGYFSQEIVPLKGAEKEICTDELPLKANLQKIAELKPAFVANGTITAANASAISDGAAVHLLMHSEFASKNSITPLATLLAHSTHAQAPADFITAPIKAIEKLLSKLNWRIQDVDLFEINEAFAVVALIIMQTLGLPEEKVNVHGGACALGHPIGASGARIVTTLIHALRKYHLKRGIAAVCIGGGEATAIAVEIKG